MRCKHCDSRLAPHDIWCVSCGHQTPIINTDLSSLAAIKRSWREYLPFRSLNVPAAAVVVLTAVVPLIVLLVVLRSFGWLDLAGLRSAGSLLGHLAVTAMGVAVFLPIFMLGFPPVCAAPNVPALAEAPLSSADRRPPVHTRPAPGYRLEWRELLSSYRNYPRYLALALICVLYYLLIYIICFGLPRFGSDPILRLVWLVLVNYFVAIILPVPVLMERLKISAVKAFLLSYRHLHAVRWQIYLLALSLAVLNLLALAALIVPLLVTLPFSWFVIRDYTDRLLAYELLPGKEDSAAAIPSVNTGKVKKP